MSSLPLFWITAFVLIAATLGALVWPLLRGRSRDTDTAPEEIAAATTVYRDQKRQLDADLAAGAISPQEHAAALEELIGRLSAEMAQPVAAHPPSSSRSPWVAALVLVAIIPAAAVLGYIVLGNPAALSPQAVEANREGISEAQMRAMVDELAQKMKANPGDPKGWLLLGRSYAALGRYDDAADAYAQAAGRMPDDAQLYADWADAAAMAQGRKLSGKPEALLARALAADPKNQKALALAATAKLERGDVEGSLKQWRELRALVAPGSDEAREIDTVIAQIGAPKRGPAATPPADDAKKPAVPVTAGALSGRVELDPKLAARVAPDDTVFILARGVEGPRMPLAVVRARVADLPKAFRLDDSMSMAPGVKLSTTPSVVVEARVSKSGNAITQPGDLRGVSGPVAPGKSDMRIVIGEIVP
jgi:cytochrome c-type biogenesis protein CcmH